MIIKEGLGFDDVLLVPKRFRLKSRKEIDISTYLTKEIRLSIPIVSSPMSNVTEAKMAIAMAREGGIGIIHRFMSIEEQVEQVKWVKRAENIIIENPYTITKDKTVKDAILIMKKLNVSGLLVEENGKLIGIITKRDVLFADENDKVEDVMTKKEDLIHAKYPIKIEEAKEIIKKHKIEKLPLVDENGFIKGLITAKDLLKLERYPNATKDKKGRLMVGAAVGLKDWYERSLKLIEAGVDVLCIDVAHGHMDWVIETVRNMRKEFGDKIQIIAGNVATKEGTKDLIDAGVDAVRVGIGSGSICTTRIVTGAGVPQITAIIDCAEVARKEEIPIIADGGIKSSGDIVKALAAEASTVMLGYLLAGTEESPGISIMRNGKKYKLYKGMASALANIERKIREKGEKIEEFIDYTPEGIEAIVPYKGTVHEIITQLVGGIRSGFSYCGASNIKELWENAEFIKVRSIKEGLPKELFFI